MNNRDCKSGSCSLKQEEINFIVANQFQQTKQNETGWVNPVRNDPDGHQNVLHPAGTSNRVKIKMFGKKDCDVCKMAVEKLNKFLSSMNSELLTMNYYDLDTLDGLTEAAVHVAFDVPTIIVETANGKEIKRWKNVPPEEEIKNVCSGLS